MGRQIRFYTLLEDEIKLLNFISNIPNTQLIKSTTITRQIEMLDPGSVMDTNSAGLRQLYIWNQSFPISIDQIEEIERTEYDESQMGLRKTGEKFYSISTNAPIIEFSRSFIRKDGKLAQGRIWCEPYRLNNGQMEFKGDSFLELYELIAKWIRRNFKRIDALDGFVGEYALAWYEGGGELFR